MTRIYLVLLPLFFAACSSENVPKPEPQIRLQVSAPASGMERERLQLDVSGSLQGQAVSEFQWAQTSGPTVTLVKLSESKVSFEVPDLGQDTNAAFEVTGLLNGKSTNETIQMAFKAYAEVDHSLIADQSLRTCLSDSHLDVGITSLVCKTDFIRSLAGLEQLQNLETLIFERVSPYSTIILPDNYTLPDFDFSALASLEKLAHLQFPWLHRLEQQTIDGLTNLEVLKTNEGLAFRDDAITFSSLSKLKHFEYAPFDCDRELIQGFNVATLSSLSNLESISFECISLYETKSFASLPLLRELKVKNSFLSDFFFLEQLSSLQLLEIDGNFVTEASLGQINKLQNLESLSASIYSIEDLDTIVKMSNLKHLSINNGISESISWTSFEQLSSLESFSLDMSGQKVEFNEDLEQSPAVWEALNQFTLKDADIANIDFVSNMPMLTTLSIDGLGYPGEETLYGTLNQSDQRLDFSALESLNNLNSLKIVEVVFEYQLDTIGQLTQLQELTLLAVYDEFRGPADGTALTKLTNLESLTVSHNIFGKLDFLENLTSLISYKGDESLFGFYTPIIIYPALDKLTKLRHFSVERIDNYEVLSLLPELESLEIMNVSGDLNWISSLESLKDLSLFSKRQEYINDISGLEALSNLEEIRLIGFTQDGLSALSNMGKLQSLELAPAAEISVLPLSENENIRRLHFHTHTFPFNFEYDFCTDLKALASLTPALITISHSCN